MINNLKKSIIITTIIILICFSGVVYGAESDNTSLAEYLNKIGLIQGTGEGFGLDEVPTRAQSAVMVVRLLGKEKEAIELNCTHPFTDVPSWADPYIGYLWQNNISKGVDDTNYGSDLLVSANDYMTFLIRVLGYDDEKGDFTWETSLQKANNLGILTSEEYTQYKQKKSFIRNDMILFSYNTLKVDLKDGNGASLLRRLMDAGIVPQTAMLDYKYAPYISKIRNNKPKNDEEFQKTIMQSMIALEPTLVLDLNNSRLSDFSTNWEKAMSKLKQLPGYYAVVTGSKWSSLNNQLTITFKYSTTKGEYDKAIKNAQQVGAQLINTNMSDYQRELLIHDYIIDNTTYYDLGNPSRNLEGVFINKKAVCGGYSQAFYYLATYAGLDSEFVLGDGIQNGNKVAHAWNTVELDGDWYQVDVTWDDPVSTNGSNKKTYAYLNLTNDEMKLDHMWDTNAYKVALGTKYNYYILNNHAVYGIDGLKSAIKVGFNNKQKEMTFKVVGESLTTTQLKSILDGFKNYKSLKYSVIGSKGVVEISNITY